MKYTNIFNEIFNLINSYNSVYPILIAIDGPDCSGKSTLSRSLLRHLKNDFKVQLFHFDDYVNEIAFDFDPKKISPDIFYNDFFDWESMFNSVIKPSENLGNEVDIIIVEGLFLLMNDRSHLFDIKIRLEIKDSLLLSRAISRDVDVLGDYEWVINHYKNQCIPAQKIYKSLNSVSMNSDLIIDILSNTTYNVKT